jgi:hypothetical protein
MNFGKKRGFSKTSRDRSGDLSTTSGCGEGSSRKRSLGDEKSRRGGKGKCGLVSSDLQDVYIGEPIGDESGYKIYSSEFRETETFTSGKDGIDRVSMTMGIERDLLF